MDLWNLAIPLSRHIRLALEDFYNMPRVGFPGDDFETKADWDLALRKMVNAFRIIEDDDFDELVNKRDEVSEGLDLFAYYLPALWD